MDEEPLVSLGGKGREKSKTIVGYYVHSCVHRASKLQSPLPLLLPQPFSQIISPSSSPLSGSVFARAGWPQSSVLAYIDKLAYVIQTTTTTDCPRAWAGLAAWESRAQGREEREEGWE